MADTAADVLFGVLRSFGVGAVFGVPGSEGGGGGASGLTNGLIDALQKGREGIRFIHARTEEGAAMMACAYAKYTGRLGVCLAGSGMGAVHLLNGLYDAKLDGQPVLALTSEQRGPEQKALRRRVHLDRLFEDVSIYNERIDDPADAGRIWNAAARSAIFRRGVAHVSLPASLPADAAAGWGDWGGGDGGRAAERSSLQTAVLPDGADLLRAAEVLNAGGKVTLLVGAGALGAGEELEELASTLAAPIVKALLGKAAVPDLSPYAVGGVGLLGTRPGQEAMEGCDTLFLIGTSFPYLEYYPRPGQARAVQLDIDPARIGLRYPVEVGLVGDSKQTLRKLLPLLLRKKDRRFLDAAQAGMSLWWAAMAERGTSRQLPMKPQVVAWELGHRLADDAIISSDSGTIATWFARQIPIRRGQMCSLSGTLATMANGLPYAIAAQVAFPGRQSVAFIGDGGFSMLMAEFETAVRHDLPIKVIVIKNNTLGQIKWEQLVMLGNPEYGCELAPMDFAAFAEACGAAGYTVADPAACGDVLQAALSAPGPALVQAVVDPLTAPLPGIIEERQALLFARSLARGQPQPLRTSLTAMSDKVREMI